jgi:protein-tyrosine phosphatase
MAGAGQIVRSGLLFRANTLSRLSDDDLARLAELKLACVIDFQHPDEIAMVGHDRLPHPPPEQVISLPLFDPEHDVFTAVGALLAGRVADGVAGQVAGAPAAGADPGARPGGLRADLIGDNAVSAMEALYRWLVSAPLARQAFGSVLQLIVSGRGLPMLFHCTAGKDRTGWLAAVILSALGVRRSAILADYLHTNAANATGVARILEIAARRMDDPAVLLPLLQARSSYLDAAFAEVDNVFGGMDGYLRHGLGMDDASLAALRSILLIEDHAA